MVTKVNEIKLKVFIPAPIEKVWAAIADWENQGDWMLQTRVWVTSDIRSGVGTSISALTGPLVKSGFKYGLLDLMVVTKWSPPHLCEVEHVGAVLKGSGKFELSQIMQANKSITRFDWSETIAAPKILFFVIYLPLYLGVKISLWRFKRSLANR